VCRLALEFLPGGTVIPQSNIYSFPLLGEIRFIESDHAGYWRAVGRLRHTFLYKFSRWTLLVALTFIFALLIRYLCAEFISAAVMYGFVVVFILRTFYTAQHFGFVKYISHSWHRLVGFVIVF
jgi:hypothetical protein